MTSTVLTHPVVTTLLALLFVWVAAIFYARARPGSASRVVWLVLLIVAAVRFGLWVVLA